jgi:hypothetical protein
MENPRVADGGDGLQIWRVAADMLSKQQWKADKRWSSSFVVGLLTVKTSTLRNITQDLRVSGFLRTR